MKLILTFKLSDIQTDSMSRWALRINGRAVLIAPYHNREGGGSVSPGTEPHLGRGAILPVRSAASFPVSWIIGPRRGIGGRADVGQHSSEPLGSHLCTRGRR